MDKNPHLESLADLLKDAKQSIKDEADKEVEVEHCINIKKRCDYKAPAPMEILCLLYAS